MNISSIFNSFNKIAFSNRCEFCNVNDFNNSMPAIDEQYLASLDNDTFELETDETRKRRAEMEAYAPQIVGVKANSLAEVYKYCQEHNIPDNTFLDLSRIYEEDEIN